MTENDRDVSARRVNINVIQAVSSHLDPSKCASPFILDNTITPVNKYRPALVIMRRTGGIFHRRRFFFFFFFCPPRCFSAISSQQRGEFSPAPSFRTGGISADPSGNKSGLWLRLSSSVKYQEPNDIWQYAGCKLACMCYDMRPLSTLISLCFMLADSAQQTCEQYRRQSHREGLRLLTV